jgi:hypothetical protein
MSCKGVTTSNPTIINIISNIVYTIHGPVDKILEIVEALFDNPITNGMGFFSCFFPKPPFFARAGFKLGGTAKPICEL